MATDLGMYVQVKATGINQVNDGLDKMAKKAGDAEKSAIDLSSAIAGIASFAAIKKVLSMADSYASMSARMKLATSSMKEFTFVQTHLLNTANRAGRSMSELQNIFIDTSGNLQDMGYSLKDTLKMTDSLTFAFTRNATSAQRAQGALEAWDFALNKKSIDVRTWQRLSTAIPTLEVDLARVYGKSLSEIQQLGFAGKLSVEMINNTLLESYDENEKAAKAMGSSIESATNMLSNNFQALVGDIDSGLGATAAIAASIELVANNIEYTLIPASALASIALVKGFNLATGAIATMNAALLANPIGLVIAGIAAAGAALYVFRDSTIEIGGELYTLKDIALGTFDAIKDAVNIVSDYLVGAFTIASLAVGNEMDDMSIDLSDIFSFIGRVMRTPANILIGSFVYAAKAVTDIFNNLLTFVKAVGGSIAYAIAWPIEKAINSITWALNEISGAVKYVGFDIGEFDEVDLTSGLKPYVDKLEELTKGIGYHAFKGVEDALTTDYIGDAVSSLFDNDYIKNRRDNKPKNDEGSLDDAEAKSKAINSALNEGKKAAKELKEALRFGAEFDAVVDNLYLEMQTSAMLQKEIDRLTFFRNVDSKAKEVAAGMSRENAAVVYLEARRVKELYDAYQLMKEVYDNDPTQGMRNGLARFLNDAGTMREAFANATNGALTSLSNGLADFVATGKLNFRDLTTSILQDIARIMTQWAIAQAVTGVMGMFGGGIGSASPFLAWSGGYIPEYATGGQVMDFSGGGFTGIGGKFEPKGVVHGGEFVMSKEAVNNLGVGYLENLHNSAKNGSKGYSNGGFVGAPPIMPSDPTFQQNQHKSEPIYIEIIVNNEDGSVETNAPQLTASLKREIEVAVDYRIKEHKTRSGGMLRGKA